MLVYVFDVGYIELVLVCIVCCEDVVVGIDYDYWLWVLFEICDECVDVWYCVVVWCGNDWNGVVWRYVEVCLVKGCLDGLLG